ncbi:uncharacterized protein LOC107367155 [Tetranychus urticae]|uniref:Decapping nuclease n=1 Tax=Tetranychus urticae TaxID=32264 RepID=T1KUE0_TETUR|nr:uncharacterized protein LOC107367155 [Tetranychus urticae]
MLSTSGNNTFVEKELDLKCARTNPNQSLEGPKRLGYFSLYCNYENESVYCPDKSALRYLNLIPNPVSIDCLQGYDPNTKYRYELSKRTYLSRWILENETIVRNLHYDFICNNGVLKDIMISPYYEFDWNLSAVKIRGKIELNKITSTGEKDLIDGRFEQSNKLMYVANNLQRLITKNSNHSQGTSGREEDSFYGVFHSKIGSHQILHSGYLGCVESEQELDKPFDEMKFVLIKKFNGPRVSHLSCHANIWWSLATLTGVDTVIRAKCERDFTIKNIDKLNVDNLIKEQRQMAFVIALNMVLDHVKSIVTEENKCYNFHFNGKDKKSTGYVKMDLVSESIIEH